MNQLTTQWISEKSSIRRYIYIYIYIYTIKASLLIKFEIV